MSVSHETYAFRLKPALDLHLERVGSEREPVLLVEGVLEEPCRLVDYAASKVGFAAADGPSGGYPGMRAAAPLNYVERVVRALDSPIRRAFGLEQVKLGRAECNFSMVTRPPAELKPLQRIPHIDTVDPLQFAILHYLCDPREGGTAFYRHRATGFETLSQERWPTYCAERDRELRSMGGDSGYILGDTDHYVQTARFDAAFDRLLVYRSCLLHSGMIAPDSRLDPDPRTGRLTANIFLTYRPA